MEVNINILLVIVIVAAALKMVGGYKRGLTKEIISLVTLLILSAVAALLVNGISSYHDGKFFNIVIVAVLLAILGIAHHLLGIVFFSAKMITKLPVIHFADKLLGAVFGILEVVLFLWTAYTFMMMMDIGMVGEVVQAFTEESQILTWLYRHNWLAYGIEHMLEEFQFLPLPTL